MSTPVPVNVSIGVANRGFNLPGVVGYWNMNEGSGSTTADSSGFGNNGTLQGSPLPSWVTGKYGQALSFQKANAQYVSATGNTILGSAAFTLSAWVKASAAVINYAGALTIGTPGTANQCAYVGASAGGGFSGGLWGANLVSDVFDTTTWHFLTLTYSGGVGGSLKLYVDAVLKASTTVTANIIGSGIQIGVLRVSTSYFWDGLIDETHVVNRDLSPSEITLLFNGLPITTSALTSIGAAGAVGVAYPKTISSTGLVSVAASGSVGAFYNNVNVVTGLTVVSASGIVGITQNNVSSITTLTAKEAYGNIGLLSNWLEVYEGLNVVSADATINIDSLNSSLTSFHRYKISITQTSSNHPTITTPHSHIEAKTFKPKILSESP